MYIIIPVFEFKEYRKEFPMTTRKSDSNNLLTYNLSEPLNGATTAQVDINNEAGNLTIDGLTSQEQVLVSGALQYFEKQGLPTKTLNSSNGQATLMLKGGGTGKPWFRLPWAACNGAHEWQIHLNPMVSFDILAHSGGGNIKLNLGGLDVTNVSTDTGGGNIDVVLPDSAADLNVFTKTGAGNISVLIPGGIEARVHAASGLGKVIVDSRFNNIDEKTYQTPGYDASAKKVEITVNSGAGNVSVTTK
jgi:hypothetical protein